MDSISQVIHDCETCAAIKQAKRVKPLWYGGRWSKYKYGEAWQIDYITLPQTRQGKRYVLTMVEATTGWLETYPVPHATARNTILGLEKQVLWRHGTPERIESDNGTHFKNSLINNWAREHGIEWVYHIPYHAPASGKIERYNGLLKTTLKALGGGSFKNWEQHLAKATWLVNTRGSTNRAGPAQSESLHTVDGEKVPVVHVRVHESVILKDLKTNFMVEKYAIHKLLLYQSFVERDHVDGRRKESDLEEGESKVFIPSCSDICLNSSCQALARPRVLGLYPGEALKEGTNQHPMRDKQINMPAVLTYANIAEKKRRRKIVKVYECVGGGNGNSIETGFILIPSDMEKIPESLTS
ncbi:hypothetical protein DUI87_10947 [Hirundo rustica rustica]|uniref:Integrase catalytic domain-containing protein n=1 Tax=Hirundo rustica rustica TaxID=333673 RepID=A0A3M0KJH4_HIRRU|nr:hypothetical protein DUI87_10947 [Hirundo rustica rustica]